MRITTLAGGVGGARFLRGLTSHLDPQRDHLTIIGNTGDDITVFGLRVCPDLDTLAYTLGDGIDEEQGWGRRGDEHAVQGELAAYGIEPQWFGLGDLDIGTHVARSLWLGQGVSLSEVTARIADRWGLPDQGVTLLPMSDEPVETHVVIADEDQDSGERAVHFQEWWVRLHAQIPARRFVGVGLDRATPAPGVLAAIDEADLILLPPSNPVVSIGVVMSVPGLRDALRSSTAPVVGVSPIIGGAPVRGFADACLRALGVESSASGVAGLYADLLDGWLVAPGDGAGPWPQGVHVIERPLLMSGRTGEAQVAGDALELAMSLRGKASR